MNRQISAILITFIVWAIFVSCDKERSLEQPAANTNPMIIGINCVPSKIISYDSVIPLGSIAATYDATDRTINISQFDSISLTLQNSANIQYSSTGDTAFLNSGQYFLLAPSGLVQSFHGLVDPSNPSS